MDKPKPLLPEISNGWLANLAEELTPSWLPPAAPGSGTQARSASASYFGPYEILSEIGRGGVARVLRVRHVHPQFAGRPTALKILQRQAGDDARIVELFRREAGVHSLIRHENIVETFEAGVQDGQPFLAMAFVAGGDMGHLLARLKARDLRLEPALSVYIIVEILQALAFAHDLRDLRERPLGLVHRDVNPSNVFLSHDGRIRLGDFGVAALASESRRGRYEIAGKAGYFAPEHLGGKEIDGRADLFAVGVTLFELLTTSRLFHGEDDDAVLAQNERADVGDLHGRLPVEARALAPLLVRALAADPRDRFASAGEMRAALQPYAAPRAPARLLLKSLVQHFFAFELSREEAMAAGGRDLRRELVLAWRAAFGASPQIVSALGDASADQAMVQLLEPLGFRAAAASDSTSLRAQLGAGPAMALVALGNAGAEASSLARPFEPPAGERPAPAWVVTGSAFTLQEAERALQLGAEDLWIRPFPASRALRGIGALLGARLPKGLARGLGGRGEQDLGNPLGRAILAVGRGAKEALLAARLPALDRVTLVGDARAAHAITSEASFDVVVIDGHHLPDVGAFLAQFRASLGMGVVPAVAINLAPTLANLTLPRFVAVPADGDLKAAIEAAQRASAGQELRAYTRFDARLAVQLRCAGQVVKASTINISRRGLLLMSPFLPSVGSDLGLRIALPLRPQQSAPDEVLVAGRAQRAVVRPQSEVAADGATSSQLGVALGRFASNTERLWVQFILAQVLPEDAGLLARAARWLGATSR